MFMRQTVECAEAPGKVETIHSNDLAIRKQGLQYRHRGVILGILKCWTQNAGVADQTAKELFERDWHEVSELSLKQPVSRQTE